MSIRATLATLCLAAATAACTPVAPPAGETPDLLGACCPETDAGIHALMGQYESTPAGERPPELAILPYRGYSGMSERERIVVRDPDIWAAVWSRVVGSHRPVPPTPAVSFDEEMVVVAGMGTRPTGGYAIYIDDVAVVRGRLVISTREQSPGRSCFTTQALTAPVAIARLKRSDLPVSFVNRSVVREC